MQTNTSITQAGADSSSGGDGVVRALMDVEDIYQHSSVRLLIRGPSGGTEFRLAVRATDPRSHARVVNLSIGRAHSLESKITSECISDRHTIDVRMTGLLNELPIQPRGKGTGLQSVLGVRWYPFVASRLRASLAIEGASITALSITVSDAVRMRRDSPVWGDRSTALRLARSYDADAWTTSIGWGGKPAREIEIDAPLQTSAATLSRLINGTVVAAVLSFVAIAVAAELASAYLALGALGTLALLLVREWRTGPRAHHLTALGAIYVGYIGLGVGWTLGWVLGGLWGLAMLPVVAFAFWWVLRTVPSFEATGQPPESFSRPLRALMARREKARERRRDRLRRSMIRRLLRDGGARMQRAKDGDHYVIERDGQVLLRLRPLDGEQNRATLDAMNDHGLTTAFMVVDDLAALIDDLRQSGVFIPPAICEARPHSSAGGAESGRSPC